MTQRVAFFSFSALLLLCLAILPAASGASEGAFAAKKRLGIAVFGSPFGKMIYNGSRQAAYVFDQDSRKKSRCYGACARAWPPVLTKGKPRAIKGARQSLLGTFKRKGGATQVTYRGRPLYYYAHEGPGQVLCHNIFLNGGLWKVVKPDGSLAE